MVIGLGGDGFIKKEPQALGSIEENSSIFRRDIVVIGASAGGVEALKKLAANLPGDLPAAIFVVVHFPVQSTSMLPKILEDSGRVPASHAVNGEPIQTGRIYVAPPNQHLQLEDGWVRLVIGPREHGFRPSIDLLFCSVAATYGERVIGVILSGTLYDGAAGMQAIHNNGGVSVVQDPAEATFPDMPRSVIASDHVDFILPISDIAFTIPEAESPEGAIHFRWLIRDMSEQISIQEEIKEIKHELIKSRERSRQQLARDLHDGPVQDLHGIIFQLKPLESKVNDPQKNSIESVETQLIDVVRKLRQLCGDLRPPALIPFGLEKAIRSHAGSFRELHPDINLIIEPAVDVSPLEEEERLELFQIYQQAMVNALRHSEASQIRVRFKFINQKSICLEVEDNGKGFEVPTSWIGLVRRHHYGLADAVERAESIGGVLEVDSQPGRGTTVRVFLPRENYEGTAPILDDGG